MHDETTRAILTHAQAALTEALATSVALGNVEPLPSPHTLLRCGLDGTDLQSVILKQVTTTEFTSGDAGVSERFTNERAGLEFVNRVAPDAAPRIILASTAPPYLILEDLGSRPRVLDRLLDDDGDEAVRALAAMGRTLAEIHAASSDRAKDFARIQEHLRTRSPRSDSSIDLRGHTDRVEQLFASVDSATAEQLGLEVRSVEAQLHDVPLWRTLLHGDAGPQNVLIVDGRAVFVDFEFSVYGHALLDAVSARLGFPHSALAAKLPDAAVAAFEAAYRTGLAVAVPQAVDDSFARAATDAAAHWALVRLVGLWDRLFAESVEYDPQLDVQRSQAFTVYRRFVETASEAGHRMMLAAAFDDLTVQLRARFPGLRERPLYPAFADR